MYLIIIYRIPQYFVITAIVILTATLTTKKQSVE